MKSRFADIGIRHLRALAAVAEEGTFQRAGDRLGFSQAAVSQQIASLEAAVGAPLFDRFGGPRPVQLTATGRLMLEHARAVLDRLDLADRELADLVEGRTARLTIGTFQSALVRLVPAVITGLRGTAPGLDVRVYESDDGEDLLGRLAEGALDLSFLVGPLRDDRLDVVPLCRDRFVVMVPASDRRAAGPDFPIAALHRSPTIGQETTSVCQRLIEDGLRAHGAVPNYVFRSNDNSAVQAMVRAGVGPAVMPALAVDPDDDGVAVLELRPQIPPREIVIARMRARTLPPIAATFIALAATVCRSGLAGPGPSVVAD